MGLKKGFPLVYAGNILALSGKSLFSELSTLGSANPCLAPEFHRVYNAGETPFKVSQCNEGFSGPCDDLSWKILSVEEYLPLV